MEPISQPHRLAGRSHALGLLSSRPAMPHFIYTETFEGGAVYTGMSAGRGKFIPLTAVSRAPCIVFVVDKDRSKGTLSIDVQSYSLCHTISNALGTHPDPDAGNLKSPDFDTLLKNYDTLKHHLQALESQQRDDLETSELRLLVEDFLLDFSIFDGMGLEHRQTLLQSYDSTERCIDVALDLVDDCFLLGLFPLDVTDDHLAALNNRYVRLALSDNLTASDTPCETGIHSEGFSRLNDPSEGAELEHSALYGSFSNLSLHIKETHVSGLFTRDLNTLPFALQSYDGSSGQFFKVESPFRKQESFGAPSSGGSASGLIGGMLSSQLTPEITDVSVDIKDVLRGRSRVSLYHNGAGTLHTATSTEFDAEYAEPPLPRSEGVSDKAMNVPIHWGTQPESVFCGAWARLSRPVAPVSTTTAFHDTQRDDGTYLPKKSGLRDQSMHMWRQQLGRNITASLTNLCKTVRDTVGKAESGSLESLVTSHFRSIEDVWNGGLGVFRQVIKNHPPSGLLEVLDCIIVADAMCTALSSCSKQDTSYMYLEFVGDIGQWRSILNPHEHALFDRISYALWLRSNPEELLPGREDQDGLARFQEALQDLVTLEKESPKVPQIRGAPYASQLRAIQRKYAAEEENRPHGYPRPDPVLIPVPSDGVRKREFDESLDMELDFENDFSINDVFDVDRFLAQSVDSESTAGQMMDLGWNDILSTTVLLLASSAFSTFLTLLTVIHRDFDSDSVLDVWRRPPGYSRSCDILGHFLDSVGVRLGRFRDVPLYRPHSFHLGTNRLSLSTMSAPPSGHTWSASSWVKPALGVRKMMRASVSAAPSPSPFTPTQMAHSLDAVRDSRRPRCLSVSCSKDFSSVSNRNKHMREGCPHREKAGYKCRNEHCTKVLTTKWYQKKHEQERCRYRGVAGGQGSWGGT